MAEGRRLKQHLTKTWYKSSRGGRNVSSTKDLPWTSQVKEKEGRRSYWREVKAAEEDSNLDLDPEPKKEVDEETGEHFKMIKNIETVVFIPATPGSQLRKKLQEADDLITKATNCPPARFVERGGPTIVDTVGRTNPMAGEWYCS